MSLRLRDAAADPRCGRKAAMLARLIAAGLPAVDGVVVLPDDDVATLDLGALGSGPYVARSSSALEDTEGASAAGLYLSLVGVAAPDLPAAISRVRASASSEEVSAYLSARGVEPRAIAVIVQPALGAVPLGIARSSDDGFVLEERAAGAPEWADVHPGRLRRGDGDPLAALLARVEALVGGPVDVEYARAQAGPILLQARPAPRLRAPVATGPLPPGRWRLDAEHNPDPISAAQAGLVALVDGRRFGVRARVIDGYLYVRDDAPSPSRDDDGGAALRRFRELEGPALRAQLAAVGGAQLPTVLATYVRVIRRYAAEVRPSLGAARARLDALLLSELGECLGDHPRLLAGLDAASQERDAALYALGRDPGDEGTTDYLARFGMYAPAWDVAVGCDDEDRAGVVAAAARRALGPSPAALAAAARVLGDGAAQAVRRRLPGAARADFDRRLAALRALVELGEDDDVLFFEGQRLVRRALLLRGRVLLDAGRLHAIDDVFELSLEDALRDAPLAALAAQGRAARLRAGRVVPPYRIIDGVPLSRLPASARALHGRGTGGHGRGRAMVIRSLTSPLPEVPAGVVLVLPTALPSLMPTLPLLAGLVTEHGGALSHGATLAREVGLAAVVGVTGALSIEDGAEVYVDGDRGRVLVLRDAPRR